MIDAKLEFRRPGNEWMLVQHDPKHACSRPLGTDEKIGTGNHWSRVPLVKRDDTDIAHTRNSIGLRRLLIRYFRSRAGRTPESFNGAPLAHNVDQLWFGQVGLVSAILDHRSKYRRAQRLVEQRTRDNRHALSTSTVIRPLRCAVTKRTPAHTPTVTPSTPRPRQNKPSMAAGTISIPQSS